MAESPEEPMPGSRPGARRGAIPDWNAPPAPGWRPHSRGILGSRLTLPLLTLGLAVVAIPALSWWGEDRLHEYTRLVQQVESIQAQARALSRHAANGGNGPALVDALDRSLARLHRDYRQTRLDLGFFPTPARIAALKQTWSATLLPQVAGPGPRPEAVGVFLAQAREAGNALRRETGRLFWILRAGQMGFLALALAAGAIAVRRARHVLLQPLVHLRRWAQRMRRGDLSARVPIPSGSPEFTALGADINRLGEELRHLKEDMEGRVQEQTDHLARKKESLEILYDVAASLNRSGDLEEILSRFLDRLMDLMDAQAGTVRLLTGDGRMRLVASRGFDDEVVEAEQLVPVDRCLCGFAVQEGRTRLRRDVSKCRPFTGDGPLHGKCPRMVAVPLRFRDQSLGIYNLFVEADRLERFGDEVNDLLESIGQHLGMAIEKSRLDQEARRLSFIEARTLLAGELHDSLAQNLASTRVVAKMLGQSVRQGTVERAEEDLEQLESSLEAANQSLRELINSFRSRLEDQDLIPAIEGHVERFRRETGLLTHFQPPAQGVELDADREVQIFHIVMEALTNVRKHSGASQAWVTLEEDSGEYRLLIEDDGRGIPAAQAGEVGEDEGGHFGLALMQERARRLEGSLTFERRREGGTRVVLRFFPRFRFEVPYPHGEEAP